MVENKDKLVAGILEETSKYLAGDLQDPAAGIKLGANISAIANKYAGNAADDALQRVSERLAKKAAERRGDN